MFQKLPVSIFLALAILMSADAVLAQSEIVNLKVNSADGVWQPVDETPLKLRPVERVVIPNKYETFRINAETLNGILERAPMEFSEAAKNSNKVVLSLPLPDGKYGRFEIVESPIMEAALAAQFPEIKSYRGQGIDDRTATTRFDVSPNGLHAIILSQNGSVFVQPYAKSDLENYISFAKSDVNRTRDFECEADAENREFFDSDKLKLQLPEGLMVANGTQLRTYRLALAATGEYTAAAGGGTVAGALAAINTSMNRINGLYERDLSVRMILVANNNTVIYTDAATDPYTNSNGSTMLGQNQTNLDSVIGTANYDIGHVFSTGGGGVATLNSPCSATSKARGVTGSGNPVGDPFDIDYVAHEMGHQFGANHTFNGSTGSCAGGNRSAASAYEPGSGITIMAYAGICGTQDLASNSIDTFHVKSLEAIVAFTNTGGGNACAVSTATGNSVPTVAATGGTTWNIPRGTPFTLTATGTDANSDALTYDWQQYDLGGATTAIPNTDSDGVARPLFRPFLPTTTGARTFPRLTNILNNDNIPPPTTGGRLTGELLPSITRTMNFQVIVRDNRAGGGGINTQTVQVNVNGASEPFKILQPNNAVTNWRPNTTRVVTWNASTTASAPVNAANVRILLSTDGGATFPTVLAASTANDGAETITVPNVSTTTARVKVEAIDNIFFDISNVNFTIAANAVTTTPFDFDRDGRADVSVFRPSNNFFYQFRSTEGYSTGQFGVSTDKPVTGDYDGDGKADVAVWRPSDGVWYRLNSSNGAFVTVQFGQNGDIPVIGDYDGDRRTDYVVYRPSNNIFYRLNSSNGQFSGFQYGLADDIPIPADYDGDGLTDIALFRPSNGVWYRVNSSNGQQVSPQWGIAGDIPAAGDYDGDGRANLAVFRPSNGTWYLINSQNNQFTAVSFGQNGDIPVPADFDGDGATDIAVFRSNSWFIRQSTNGNTSTQFGVAGDKPTTLYVPQ